jgi:NADPH:quinone reductase-like Zn-dependent oxidoreductase
MRAVVYDRYGAPEVQRLEVVERPVPKDDEILVKIHATTVNRGDCGWRSGKRFSRIIMPLLGNGGVFQPKRRILGGELAGEVEAVGAAVTEFAVGDHVFGTNLFGAHAEFVCMRESDPLAHMPANMTFEEAAAVCDGAILALGCLRRADLRKGQRLLVYGASGSIGTAAVHRAVIDRSYPLEEVVEATRYVETQQKTGNVVLTVNGGTASSTDGREMT